jgi:integrase
MGLYRRKWKGRDGKTHQSPTWWMSFMLHGKQRCETTGVTNRRVAQKICDARRGGVAEDRFDLLKKDAPRLMDWSKKYLTSVQHPNTRRRYAVSKGNLISFFGEDTKLEHIKGDRIEQYKHARRAKGIKAATLNRDLRFLAQLLKQAERERYIARSPFDLGKFFLNEGRERRKPYVLQLGDQEKLLAVARPRIRALIILGVETGMRTGEMLSLRWNDLDFLLGAARVEKSKTAAGIRSIPLTQLCKAELLRWRNLVGAGFSEWVFPNFSNRRHRLQGGRKAWASDLKKAGLPFFPIYYLRHTFASRLTTAGVSPLTIANLLGHSSTQIVPRYAQVLDQNRLDAIGKLASLQRNARRVAEEHTPPATGCEPHNSPLCKDTNPAGSRQQPNQA